jgi:hypothetical protein
MISSMKTHSPSTILLILVGVLLASFSRAADNEPITINNSVSPDGRKNIVIIPGPEDTGVAEGTAKIRDIKTGHTLGSFEWSGFGGSPNADAFKVLWRPDNRCFAISFELTRGFVTCAVYAEYRNAWVKVELPDFYKFELKMSRDAGPDHVQIMEAMGGKGGEIPQAWLPNDCLRIEAAYRSIANLDMGEDREQLFWVTVQITTAKQSKPKVVLKSVEFAPASAYPR